MLQEQARIRLPNAVRGERRGAYKWWALSCTSLGMLMATINSGTLIIALPDLERALHTPLLELVWVILVYMIVSTVLVLTAGRLSDLFGRKQAYVLGFAVFTLASLAAGFAADGRPADPAARRPGHRRRLPLRELGRDRHGRVPARGARPRDGHELDGRRRRPRDRAGARRRARRALLALGLLVQRAARRRSGRSGRPSSCASWPSLDQARRLDPLGTRDLPRRPHRASCSRSRAAGSTAGATRS